MNSNPTMFQSTLSEPLAARMRPRVLDEYIGQEHIVGHGRLLRRAITADQLSSVIFYGPPGTGKTTLARVIANTTAADFIAVNAVLDGVKQIREAVVAAQRTQRLGRRTILFVDEVHRFNKAQQDALLPWVESGTIILIGATTENPYFEVNKALVSRSRIFQLTPLKTKDIELILAQALNDVERGYGNLDITFADDALQHLVNVANGDARAALNALELAVETTPPIDGKITITLAIAEESIQQRAVLYDKEGDTHFDVISAYIKSIRGSDPDAALYWLATMIYAGEDPRFIFRRLLILASEDVGLADPAALGFVVNAAQAFDYVGLPEGRYHLAQATLYLATAPKSNSTLGFFDALRAIEQKGDASVPNHLKDNNRDGATFGHGAGYKYPHAYQDHWVAQQYLPKALQGKQFYQPSSVGYEGRVKKEVIRRREAQLSAMTDGMSSSEEILSYSPPTGEDVWLERTASQAGEALSLLRDRVFAHARIQRHHRVLDVAAGTGFFTFQALREAPEGQVIAISAKPEQTDAIQQASSANLTELRQPIAMSGSADAIMKQIVSGTVEGISADWRADTVIGRGALASADANFYRLLGEIISPDGRVVFAELDPAQAQRLYHLVDWNDHHLRDSFKDAEEHLYSNLKSLGKWSPSQALAIASQTGVKLFYSDTITITSQRIITHTQVDRWFQEGSPLRTALATKFSAATIKTIHEIYRNQLPADAVPWNQTFALITNQTSARG